MPMILYIPKFRMFQVDLDMLYGNLIVSFIKCLQKAKVKKFHLDTVKFEDIFSGPMPQFEFSEIKVKKPPAPKKESKEPSPAPAKKSVDNGIYVYVFSEKLV
jgi:hypothetical protein